MSVAIVTGASRGLGRALAEGLVREGWSVVIDARDPDTLEGAADALRNAATSGARVHAVTGDITDPAHRTELVRTADALGGLDLLVNNAGTLGAAPLPALADYPLDALRVAFEINVVSPLALVQQALPVLLASERPRLITITSDAAVEPYEGWGGYGAGKAALDQLSAVLDAENPGLTVWSVDPGDLRTDMHQAAYPGEDISDRAEPASVVPAFVALVAGDRPSGRYRAAELLSDDEGSDNERHTDERSTVEVTS
jgi:NAD(P)-dependent dehydrogenase (short-subunit alcohol dehydrogenase family)